MTSQENTYSINTDQYRPGTCNIGPAEIKRRRNSALISGLVMVAEIILLLVFNVDRLWRLTLLIPAASFGIGMLQWKMKFCVAFGMRGIFNFREIGNTTMITEEDNLNIDRVKSRNMISIGIVFGIMAALIFYFV